MFTVAHRIIIAMDSDKIVTWLEVKNESVFGTHIYIVCCVIRLYTYMEYPKNGTCERVCVVSSGVPVLGIIRGCCEI